MDTIVGFTLVGVLSLALVVAITRTNTARQRLDEDQAALRIAQRTLAELRAGKPVPAAPEDAKISVAPASAEGTLPAGREWVEVSVTLRGRTAKLTGLVAKGGAR